MKPVENDKHTVSTLVTEVHSERPFSKNLYHIETSQLTCIANQMTGSYKMQPFTDR